MTHTSVLAPGAHTLADASAVRVTSEDFCDALIAAFGKPSCSDQLYRMGRVPGIIRRAEFIPLTPHALRVLIDSRAHIEQHRLKNSTYAVTYIPCTHDWACMFLDRLACVQTSPAMLPLCAVVPHPVPGLDPGWNAGIPDTRFESAIPAHVYVAYDAPPDVAPTPIDDLVADFGLDPVSHANFLALLLTILSRPILRGPAPLFIVTAPVAGAGKSLLLDAIAGLGVYGASIPCMVWPSDPDEVRKTITSALVSGSRVLVIDNAPEHLESPALASLLTTMVWRDRMLGQSLSGEFSNTLTLAITGNRVQATGELARRSVVIALSPACDSPELRRGWRYQDIRGEASRRRDSTLAWLLGLVTAWEAAGSPPPPIQVGSFEAWSRLVLGPLRHAGYQAMEAWVQAAHDLDGARQDAEALVARWWEVRQGAHSTASDLLPIAIEAGCYEAQIAARSTQRGQEIVVGTEVRRLVGSVVGGLAITEGRCRGGRYYALAMAGSPV